MDGYIKYIKSNLLEQHPMDHTLRHLATKKNHDNFSIHYIVYQFDGMEWGGMGRAFP